MQFLKDTISFGTGNMHHAVGIKPPPVQWLMQCLQEEVMHFGGVWLQRACTGWDCSVHELQGSMLRAEGPWIAQTCRKCFLEANWVKSRASPATNHQCKKVACISAAPSLMYYKVVLKRAHWDPGVTYSKLPLHAVGEWWEWRTGRHIWKKLYQGTLAGSMDYSTGCKSDRHHGYFWDNWSL